MSVQVRAQPQASGTAARSARVGTAVNMPMSSCSARGLSRSSTGSGDRRAGRSGATTGTVVTGLMLLRRGRGYGRSPPPWREAGSLSSGGTRLGSDDAHAGRLRALLALVDLELHPLALVEVAEAAAV